MFYVIYEPIHSILVKSSKNIMQNKKEAKE